MNTKTQYAILARIENVIRAIKARKEPRPVEKIIDELISLGCLPILGKTLLLEQEKEDLKDTLYDRPAQFRKQRTEQDRKSTQIRITVDIPLL
ncbi:hypothetical protein [uncultured Rikenella sp.]|uniref:hypothetical protein n=1 Tax=uncultured Rikenella sp. TaxID=368003 RepID=UPI002608D2CE|nr:hypothetical protein [uncultured Rikenella sp.]